MGNTHNSSSSPRDILFDILAFCPLHSRLASFPLISKTYYELYNEDSTWKWQCRALSNDTKLYCPRACNDWRTLFMDLYQLRGTWTAGNISVRRFTIDVFARFRPLPQNMDSSEIEQQQQIVLPLHQRLQVLKSQGLDKSEVHKQLWSSKRGRVSPDPWETAVVPLDENGDVIMKPVDKESPIDKPDQQVETTQIGLLSIQPQELWICAPGVGIRQFNFNNILSSDSQQPDVYQSVAPPVIRDFLNGYNGSIICYGQTGSGKTYTMFGRGIEDISCTGLNHFSGVVPRVCNEIFTELEERREHNVQYKLAISYVEVYGNDISDLINEKAVIGSWQGVSAQAFLQGEAQVTVTSLEQIENILQKGETLKRKAATAMNERSSRAHTVLMFNLVQTYAGVSITSKLYLVDLGGSEQLKKSGARGAQMKDTININIGLFALNNCIKALNERANYIPYQDSRLTLVLSAVLGGGARTMVIINGSMEPRHSSETMQALRFGERCQLIRGEAKRRVTLADTLASLNQAIKECEENIKRDERWENVKRTQVDEYTGETESKMVSIPVGAEEHRQLLEELLERRRALLGK